MVITIKWSHLSKKQLKDIFDYYKTQASIAIAGKIVANIVARVSILEKNPKAGQIEELLIAYQEEWYLVEGNYKIIYWQMGNKITIASVFDCRQNPEMIKKNG